jgi:hypothetical protein
MRQKILSRYEEKMFGLRLWRYNIHQIIRVARKDPAQGKNSIVAVFAYCVDW